MLIRGSITTRGNTIICLAFSNCNDLSARCAVITCLRIITRICAVRRMIFVTSTNNTSYVNDATSGRILTSIIVVASGRRTILSHVVRILQFNARGNVIVRLIPFSRTNAIRGFYPQRGGAIVASFRIPFSGYGKLSNCVLTSFYNEVCVDWQACRDG